MYQGRVCLSEVWPDRITFDDHNTQVQGREEFSLPSLLVCALFEHRGESRSTIPLRHERCARACIHTSAHTLLSSTASYRLLSVLSPLFPLHLSSCSHKSSPVAIGIKRPIHESTLFRARLQDLLMVMGARVPVGSRASRGCGDYLPWLFEGQ